MADKDEAIRVLKAENELLRQQLRANQSKIVALNDSRIIGAEQHACPYVHVQH
jgi:capsule polysaccharide export protein KpsE/RkpR